MTRCCSPWPNIRSQASNGGNDFTINGGGSRGGSSTQQNGTSQTAMQRWLAETVNDQPYHGIQATNVEERDGNANVQSRGSSVGYLDPKESGAQG